MYARHCGFYLISDWCWKFLYFSKYPQASSWASVQLLKTVWSFGSWFEFCWSGRKQHLTEQHFILLHWWGKTLPAALLDELCSMNYEVFSTSWWEQQASPVGELRIIYSGPCLCPCPRPRQFSHRMKAHRMLPPSMQGLPQALPVRIPVPGSGNSPQAALHCLCCLISQVSKIGISFI